MAWLQLSLDLGTLELESVQTACEELGALSVTLMDAAEDPVLEPLPGTTPLWKQTRIVALFSAPSPDSSGHVLAHSLAQKLGIDIDLIVTEPLADRDWSSEWRKDITPTCFGERLWVCQDGQRPAQADALIIDLDPGLAFGTGAHPSTALCLEWLSRAPLRGRHLIDYGCGSGILAIAAARLGAASVIATDIDEQALLATRDNAERNQVGELIEVLPPEALASRETDILVANILSNPLRKLAPEFARLVRHGGLIALAGLLQEQTDSVKMAYKYSFGLKQSGQRGEWALLSGRRHLSAAAAG